MDVKNVVEELKSSIPFFYADGYKYFELQLTSTGDSLKIQGHTRYFLLNTSLWSECVAKAT